jgi:hypothetical protein
MKANTSLLFAVLIVIACGCIPSGPTAKVTVRVVDDSGSPVEGAFIAVLGDRREREGKTGQEGSFRATLRTMNGKLEIVAKREGYYPISRHIFEFTGEANDRWQPWDSIVELQLRKKGTPVAMLEKDVQSLRIPVNDQQVGFDLELADWVPPHGQGKISDFVFLARSKMTNDQEYTSSLHLTFSNPQDGLISRPIHWRNDHGLALPAIAPESGYSNRWEFVLNVHLNPVSRHRETVSSSSQDDNFYFIIRTKVADDGQILSAMYGKIHGGIRHRPEYPSGKISVRFYYYVNTNGTRNTESISDRRRDGDTSF